MRLIDADKLMENKFKNDISYNAFCNLVKRQPSIDAVPVKDGTLKARSGNYVTYRIDWLLDNLAQEISLLEGHRRGRKEDG